MVLKLKVGRKGYIILPKSIREAVGIEEGDEVLVEVKDAIIIKPLRRVDKRELRRRIREHVKELREVSGRLEPKPGELKETYFEEEFDE